jgi:hypothetical protein
MTRINRLPIVRIEAYTDPPIELSISESEQEEWARERRHAILQLHGAPMSALKRTLLAALIEGATMHEVADRLGLPVSDVLSEVSGIIASADLAAAQLPAGVAPDAGTSMDILSRELIEARYVDFRPASRAIPDSAGWLAIRLPEEVKVAPLELWLLENVGPGNSGAYDLKEAQDRWMLGMRHTHLIAWFKHEADYRHFVATWFTPQVTSTTRQ